MEVPEESFHWSSWDSRTCYPRRAFIQGLTDDKGRRAFITISNQDKDVIFSDWHALQSVGAVEAARDLEWIMDAFDMEELTEWQSEELAKIRHA